MLWYLILSTPIFFLIFFQFGLHNRSFDFSLSFLILYILQPSLTYLVVYFGKNYNLRNYDFFLLQAARNNVLLAVPALLYAVNNYLKFTMQVNSYIGPLSICLGFQIACQIIFF